MPNPLSHSFVQIFEKQYQPLINELGQLGYNIENEFLRADSYQTAIGKLITFCGKNYSALYSELPEKNLYEQVDPLISTLKRAEKLFNEEELRNKEKALELPEEANKGSGRFYKQVLPIEQLVDIVEEENNVQTYSYNDNEDYDSSPFVDELISDIYQQPVSNEQEFSDFLETDQNDVYDPEDEVDDPIEDKHADLAQHKIQKQIELLQQLVQASALSSVVATNAVQQAIERRDINNLLAALLAEIYLHADQNSGLNQFLAKTLITAYLLLNPPKLEQNSDYLRLLEFLLQQQPINENLLLTAIKWPVKIYRNVSESYAHTSQFLDAILALKNDARFSDSFSVEFLDEVETLKANLLVAQQGNLKPLIHCLSTPDLAVDEQLVSAISALNTTEQFDNHIEQIRLSLTQNFAQIAPQQHKPQNTHDADFTSTGKTVVTLFEQKQFTGLAQYVSGCYKAYQNVTFSHPENVEEATEKFAAQLRTAITVWFDAINTVDAYALSIQALEKNDASLLEIPLIRDTLLSVEWNEELIAQLDNEANCSKVLKPLFEWLHKAPQAVTERICRLAEYHPDNVLKAIDDKYISAEEMLQQMLIRVQTTQQQNSVKTEKEQLVKLKKAVFNQDIVILLQTMKTSSSQDPEFIEKQFTAIVNKAKDVNELLRLVRICQDNELLLTCLARTLYQRFPNISHLKTLMVRVKTPAIVAQVIDEIIQQQISASDSLTIADYQRLIQDANYSQVFSPTLVGLIKRYFAFCQQQENAEVQYQQFAQFLRDNKLLAMFIESVLSGLVQGVLEDTAVGSAKTAKCEWLLNVIQQHLVPHIDEATRLQNLLNQHCKKISNFWLNQLMAAIDSHQLILPEEIIEKCKIIDGDEAVDGQVFVTTCRAGISKFLDAEQIPSLEQLKYLNNLPEKLSGAIENFKADISKRYTEFEKNHREEFKKFLKDQEAFVQDLDKTLEGLKDLRQEARDKKATVSGVFTTIQGNPGKDAVNCQAQVNVAAIDQKFAEMESATNGLIEELEQYKNSQSNDGEQLTQHASSDEELLPSAMMWKLSTHRRAFLDRKATTNNLVRRIEAQISEVRKDLVDRTDQFKKTLHQELISLAKKVTEVDEENTKCCNLILASEQNIAQIGRDIRVREDDIGAIKNLMTLRGDHVGEQKTKLIKLQTSENSLRLSIQKSIEDKGFKESIEDIIGLIQQAIELRKTEKYGFFAKIKREISEFIQKYQSAFWMPNFAIKWHEAFTKDIDEKLPEEIRQFETQVDQLTRIKEFGNPNTEGIPEDIRTHVVKLLRSGSSSSSSQSEPQEENNQVSLTRDPRASFITRWWNHWKVKSFAEKYNSLGENYLKLTEVQTEMNVCTIAISETENQLATYQQQVDQEIPTEIKQLTEEKNQLTEKLEQYQSTQLITLSTLNKLKENHQKLAEYYEKILPLASSSLVEILYDDALNDQQKTSQLQANIQKNRNSLFDQGLGEGIYGNIVYHVARKGNIGMLECICDDLSEFDKNAFKHYLSERIVENGVWATPLSLAVMKKEKEKVIYLINKGSDPNQKICSDNVDETPLLWAYKNNFSEIVDILRSRGANCQEPDNEGNTLLHLAAERGDVDIILKLLDDSQLCLDTKNHSQNTPLELLMRSKSLPPDAKYALMQKFFQRQHSIVPLDSEYFATLDQQGCNSLHRAILNKDLLFVKWLLNHEKNIELLINSKTRDGKTPLVLAMESNQPEMVQFLLNQYDVGGIQEVFLAALVQDRSEEMIREFLTHNEFFHDVANPRKFLRRLFTGDQLKVKELSHVYLKTCVNLKHIDLLTRYGADANAVDEEDNTVLHWATMQGDVGKVKYLVEQYKVDSTAKNHAGLTPLMKLYQSRSFEEGKHQAVVNYLIGQAQVSEAARKLPFSTSSLLNDQDTEGNTLLHYVAQVGDFPTIQRLLMRETSFFGQNPASKFSDKDHGIFFDAFQSIRRSLYFGENPLDRKNKAGETAAHLLIKNTDLKEEFVVPIINIFSEYDADFRLQDSQEKMPLDYAEDYYVILALIAALKKKSDKLSDAKLEEIAWGILQTDMKPKEAKECIVEIAKVNGSSESQAINFFNRVKKGWDYNIEHPRQLSTSDDNRDKESFIHSFNRLAKEEDKSRRFGLMIFGRDAEKTAWIFDSKSTPFPESANNSTISYLDLGNRDRGDLPNFWIRVVSELGDKALSIQAYGTKYTLLHAFISLGDEDKLYRLSKAGVLYVTEKDSEGRTIFQFLNEKLPIGLVEQNKYDPTPFEGQSAYFSVLQSMERRLMVEFNSPEKNRSDAIRQIIAELDFDHITELEMLASLLQHLDSKSKQLLWSLPDQHGKMLAASAIAVVSNKRPSDDERHQNLLTDLWSASGVVWDKQLDMGDSFKTYQTEAGKQIQYFSDRSGFNYGFSLAQLKSFVVEFGKTSGKPDILRKYENLCADADELIKLLAAASPVQTNLSSDEQAKQLQKKHAKEMIIYLGIFFEVSGLDALATLPAPAGKSNKSLLAVARENKLLPLYIETINTILVQLGVGNPIELVEKTQTETAITQAREYQTSVEALMSGSSVSFFPPSFSRQNNHGGSFKIKRTTGEENVGSNDVNGVRVNSFQNL